MISLLKLLHDERKGVVSMRKKVLYLLMAGVLASGISIPAMAQIKSAAVYGVVAHGGLSFAEECKESALSGTVTEIEKYGHAVTSISIAEMKQAGFAFGDIVTVAFDNGFTVDAPYLPDYTVEQGGYVVRGYSGHTYVAVCINYGKLSEVNGIGVGANVTISMKEAGGYLAEYEMRRLERTNDRDDYSSDEVFANFRSVEMGSLAKGVLYRSASPINPEIGRAVYGDDLAAAAGIATVLNLADSRENLEGYFGGEEFDSPYYKSLYDAGQVCYLNLSMDYTSEEFMNKLGQGLIFLSEHEGPYLIHCTEGKDRAGFTAALIEALMGGSLQEIREDYMLSYQNYYGVEKDSAKYYLIQSTNLDIMLRSIAGLEKDAGLTGVDLAAAAANYMRSCGLSETQIEAVRAAFSRPLKTKAAA